MSPKMRLLFLLFLLSFVRAQNVCIIANQIDFTQDVATTFCLNNSQNVSLCLLNSIIVGSGQCRTDNDCDDANSCTLDICQPNKACHHIPIHDCCRVSADCVFPPTACHNNGTCVNATGTGGSSGNASMVCYYPQKDQDGDGVPCNLDCNDLDPTVGYKIPFAEDRDLDGFANPGSLNTIWGCGDPPVGYAWPYLMDCDDNNHTSFYGAINWPFVDPNLPTQEFPSNTSATVNSDARYGASFTTDPAHLILAVGIQTYASNPSVANRTGAVEILWRAQPLDPFLPLTSPTASLLLSASPTQNEVFGSLVELPRTDMLVISAPGTKKVYVFYNPQGNTSAEPAFVQDVAIGPLANLTEGNFGSTIAAADVYFAVAGKDVIATPGTVPYIWVFRRETPGTPGTYAGTFHNYTLVQRLAKPFTDSLTSFYGGAIAMTPQMLITSDNNARNSLNITTGVVYIYLLNSTFVFTRLLDPPNNSLANQGFGNSLSLSSAGTLLVGASGANNFVGAAYGFTLVVSGSNVTVHSTSNSPTQGVYVPWDLEVPLTFGIGFFGSNVAVDYAHVGTPMAVISRASIDGDCGAFYAYVLAGAAWHASAEFSFVDIVHCNATNDISYGSSALQWDDWDHAYSPPQVVDTFVTSAPALLEGKLFLYENLLRRIPC